MSDERPDSLAAQAASWVPPWEREQPPLDRDYQAANQDPSGALDEPDSVGRPDEDEKVAEADLTDDDDDFDEAFEGPNPPGYQPTDQAADADTGDEPDGIPAELPPLPGESSGPATVDSPTELEGDSDSPIDVGVGPDIEVPASIEDAAEDADDEAGDPVDAPLPPDGDDAGDVFDAAADDDVSNDDDVDLPFAEEVPEDDTAQPGSPAPDDDAADADPVDDAPDADPADEAPDVDPADDAHDVASADSARGVASADAAGGGGAVGTAVVAGVGSIPGQGRRPRANAEAAEVRTPEVESSEAPPIDDSELRAALEAILLVVDEPVAEMQLAQIMEQPTERVASMLDDISARYTAAGHGFDLRRAAGGWRLYTRPEYAAYVERFVLDGQSVRLTQAALETLAVVAYKQPVTRSRISAIRGVNCDGVMRTLATRGLIEECGTEGETGAYLYRTTVLFLEKLGLNSVDQLPPLAPFLPDDVEEVLDASG